MILVLYAPRYSTSHSTPCVFRRLVRHRGEKGKNDRSDRADTRIIIKQSSTVALCVNMSPSTLFEEVPLNLVLYYLICKVGCFFRPPHHGPIDIAIMPQIDP